MLVTLLDDLEGAVDAPGYAAAIESAVDEAEKLRLVVAFHCALFERGLDLIDAAHRSSADPVVRAFVDEGDRRRRLACERWVRDLDTSGALSPGIDPPTAVDLLRVHCGADLYAAFAHGCGWQPARIER